LPPRRRRGTLHSALACLIETVALTLDGDDLDVVHQTVGQRDPEIEIVVQALAAVRPYEGPVRLLVMPGLVGIAGFHRREDVHRPRAIAALLQHPRNNIPLADVGLADALDAQVQIRTR
jgi:hypothetical protein